LPHIKRGEVVCPYCGQKIKKVDAYRIWTKSHVKILGDLSRGKVREEEILSTHIILVRQTGNGYKVADDEDFKAFLEACEYLSTSFNEIQRYLPMDSIPEENEVFGPVKSYGIKYWYQLFNPRQLLSIAFLIKYVDERISMINSMDDVGKASMLYLALGISRVIDYNSIVTTWKKGTIRDTLGQYARNRKVSYGEAYCEAIVPRRNLRWIFETDVNKKTQGGIVPVLDEICKRLEGLGDRVSIFHGDARKLASYINEKFDLINVDPPYFDTHIYSDISEYFWQVLRLAVKQLIDDGFIFNNKKIVEWDVRSQTVPREGELIVRKSKKNDQNKFDEIWYAKQMLEFFKEAHRTLKDDGLLIVWFTHRTLNAWKSIISALYGSNFYVTRIWPVTTELLTRLVAKKNNVLDRTLIIIAKKKLEAKIDMKEHAQKLAYEIANALKEISASGRELKTFLYAAIMSSVTVMPLQNDPIHYCYSELIPKSLDIADEIIPKIVGEFHEKNNESSGKFFEKR
jgi:adenine-specific DNA methylase